MNAVCNMPVRIMQLVYPLHPIKAGVPHTPSAITSSRRGYEGAAFWLAKLGRYCMGCLLLLLAPSLQAQNTAGSALQLDEGVNPHAQIDAIYARFSQAYKTLDPALVANVYTDDALYLEPNSPIKRGRASIQEGFAGFFNWAKENNKQLDISFRIVSRQISESLAYDVGVYTLKTLDHGKEMRSGQGKFVVVARKLEDGSWKFHVDGYSDIK